MWSSNGNFARLNLPDSTAIPELPPATWARLLVAEYAETLLAAALTRGAGTRASALAAVEATLLAFCAEPRNRLCADAKSALLADLSRQLSPPPSGQPSAPPPASSTAAEFAPDERQALAAAVLGGLAALNAPNGRTGLDGAIRAAARLRFWLVVGLPALVVGGLVLYIVGSGYTMCLEFVQSNTVGLRQLVATATLWLSTLVHGNAVFLTVPVVVPLLLPNLLYYARTHQACLFLPPEYNSSLEWDQRASHIATILVMVVVLFLFVSLFMLPAHSSIQYLCWGLT